MGHVNQLRELRAESRSESCLVPLGLPLVAKPEAGPTGAAYFRAKHARGDRGRFHLHQIEGWQGAGDPVGSQFRRRGT